MTLCGRFVAGILSSYGSAWAIGSRSRNTLFRLSTIADVGPL
jgi:hypothetical protein